MRKVTLGTKVKIILGSDVKNFELVENTFTEPGLGKISIASPLGSALLGHGEGEVVEVRTPKDTIVAKIAQVS